MRLLSAASMGDVRQCRMLVEAHHADINGGDASFVARNAQLLEDSSMHPETNSTAPTNSSNTAKAAPSLTPLHMAAQSGKAETLTLLLTMGADPCPFTPNGRTPLMLAVLSGDPTCVSVLAAHTPAGSAGINHRDAVRFMPLSHVVHTGWLC